MLACSYAADLPIRQRAAASGTVSIGGSVRRSMGCVMSMPPILKVTQLKVSVRDVTVDPLLSRFVTAGQLVGVSAPAWEELDDIEVPVKPGVRAFVHFDRRGRWIGITVRATGNRLLKAQMMPRNWRTLVDTAHSKRLAEEAKLLDALDAQLAAEGVDLNGPDPRAKALLKGDVAFLREVDLNRPQTGSKWLLGEQFMLNVAAAYAGAARGSSPIQAVMAWASEEKGEQVSKDRARKWVQRCRKPPYDYLTVTGPGRRGGRLKANALRTAERLGVDITQHQSPEDSTLGGPTP